VRHSQLLGQPLELAFAGPKVRRNLLNRDNIERIEFRVGSQRRVDYPCLAPCNSRTNYSSSTLTSPNPAALSATKCERNRSRSRFSQKLCRLWNPSEIRKKPHLHIDHIDILLQVLAQVPPLKSPPQAWDSQTTQQDRRLVTQSDPRAGRSTDQTSFPPSIPPSTLLARQCVRISSRSLTVGIPLDPLPDPSTPVETTDRIHLGNSRRLNHPFLRLLSTAT